MKIFAVTFVESVLFFIFLLILVGNSDKINLQCIITQKTYTLDFPIIVAVAWFLGFIEMLIFQILFLKTREKQKITAYKKQYEKNAVSEAEKDNQIKALENKVKTLETALESVLKKNN